MLYKCLAPMDGVTDVPFRKIIRKYNTDVHLYSEFTHAMRIKAQLHDRLSILDGDQKYIAQIFGNDPQQFQYVKLLEDIGCAGVDINMGCPSKKIANSQHGSALMKAPDLAARIVEACAEKLNIPVSVKTRLGWEDHLGLVDFIRRLIDAGVSLVIIHGRTYHQKFKGEANWEPIYDLKKHVSIPVIGNGDVKNHHDGMTKLNNLDGYMIGRASYGKPWLFWDEEQQQTPDLKFRLQMLLEHFNYCLEQYSEKFALINLRKHLKGYLFGHNFSNRIREELMHCTSQKEFTHLILSIN